MSLTDDLGGSTEAALLRRARTGDGPAFGALYERHLGVARRLARSLVADHSDADDVVAEVFAATFVAMRRGQGPADDFRSYVLRSVRRECQRTWRRGARQRPGGEVVVDMAAARSTGRDDFDWFGEGEVVSRAFGALSPRLQHVLWLTEIEGLSHEDIATRLGTTAVNVAQLARRARLEFGEHYLEAHLPVPDGPVPAACTRPRQVLAEVVRGTASRRAERLAADHVATCAACAGASAELEVVNGRLRSGHIMALLPAIDATRPVTAGLVAKLAAWIGGPVPTMSAVVSLAVATAVVPPTFDVVEPVADAAPAAAPVTADEPDPVAVPVAPVTPGPATRAATPGAGVAEPVETAADAAAADGEPAVIDPFPSLASALGAVSGVAVAPGVPAADALLGAVGAVPLSGPVLDAALPVLGALPPTSLEAGVGALPVLPVVTPAVEIGATVDDGATGADIAAGDGDVEVTVGQGGVAVDVVVPPVDDVVDALPLPELPVVAPVAPLLPGG